MSSTLGSPVRAKKPVKDLEIFLRHALLVPQQLGGEPDALGFRSLVNKIARRTECGRDQV